MIKCYTVADGWVALMRWMGMVLFDAVGIIAIFVVVGSWME